MKVCPVCKARAFDDADVCYGCLYSYDEEDLFTEEVIEYEPPENRLLSQADEKDLVVRFEICIDSQQLIESADRGETLVFSGGGARGLEAKSVGIKQGSTSQPFVLASAL